ncbi:sodium:proton antiporter NhaD [Aliiglaciecola sp. CAU 1673]|uniref:sodium:proton antiporter NhaD n=1 Tax=Aliiglaciecola sp. CAU 1673 TaxID=3032595 RepID=UPI0023DA3E1D|nr:sodium:proton antiporter NhaD [Aliiglaciecola sp. CAU 1673]MDF2178716.1 sodium:proton antiporter NhaD [Aliiglaciecola sp. CAU 1673]
MPTLDMLLIAIALLALLGVIFEEVTHISKAKVTLFAGTVSWIMLYIQSAGGPQASVVDHQLHENIAEIANLWLFLVAAMTFVAYLNKKRLIESLMNILLPAKMSERKMMFITGAFCFFFSSLADNITATLVAIAMVLQLGLDKAKTVKFAVLTVFAVNSGGVALITGDVTTLMIFLEGKTRIQDLMWLSVPSFLSVMLLAALLSVRMNGRITLNKHRAQVEPVDVLISLVFLATILCTIAGNILFSIPPVLSFLCGLSLMFLIAHFLRPDQEKDPILDYIRRIEFDTLLFFLGILLLVGMLKHIQVLELLLQVYQLVPLEWANFLMGILSAFIDNVPLTAALLKADIMMDRSAWLELTYAVGVGGSMMVIGSAAGIVAMSKVKGLTFAQYARYSLLLLFCYGFGYLAVRVLVDLLAI